MEDLGRKGSTPLPTNFQAPETFKKNYIERIFFASNLALRHIKVLHFPCGVLFSVKISKILIVLQEQRY